MTNKELLSRATRFDGGPIIIEANGYITPENYKSPFHSRYSIEVRDGFYGRKWAIYDNGNVFSKSKNRFIYEVSSSSRTDEFIQDTRFNSVSEAFKVLEAWKIKQREVLRAAGWEERNNC